MLLPSESALVRCIVHHPVGKMQCPTRNSDFCRNEASSKLIDNQASEAELKHHHTNDMY